LPKIERGTQKGGIAAQWGECQLGMTFKRNLKLEGIPTVMCIEKEGRGLSVEGRPEGKGSKLAGGVIRKKTDVKVLGKRHL